MSEEELKLLKKEVSKKKRIATELASEVHDLVEDRLMSGYPELVELAEKTVAACESWSEAKSRYEAAEA